MNKFLSSLLITVCLFLVSFLFWRGCLDDFFSQDDFFYMEHASYLSGDTGALVSALLKPGPVDNDYIPLTSPLYFTLMRSIFGLNPFPYHFANWFLFSLNGLLIFFLSYLLFRNRWLGLISSLFFLTRGLAFVPVFWVSNIQDHAGLFASLLFLILMVRFYKDKRKLWFALALVAYVPGTLAKEFVFLMPVALYGLVLILKPPQDFQHAVRSGLGLWPFILAGILSFTLMAYTTTGYESPVSFGGFEVVRFIYFLTWTFSGSYHLRKTFVILVPVLYLSVLCLPVLFRRKDTHLPYYTPLIFVGIAFVLASPMLIIKDRLAQYYAYYPSVFIGLGLFSVLCFFKQASRIGPTLLSAAFLLISMSNEYSVIRAKDKTSFIKASSSYEKDPDWDWSGGWLNTDHRHRVNNLYKSIRNLSGKLPKEKFNLILAGYIDVFVSGNPTESAKRLKSQSSSGSMLRVFLPNNPMSLYFFMPGEYKIEPNRRGYFVSPAEFNRIVHESKKPVFLGFVDYEGTILDLQRVLPHSLPSAFNRLEAFYTHTY